MRHSSRPARGTVAIIVAGVLAGGCAQDLGETLSGPRPVSLAEFADRSASDEAPTPETPAVTEVADSSAPKVRLGAGSEEVERQVLERLQQQETEDAEVRAALQTRRPGDRVLVDSLVGQINGRPIFADDILRPVEDRIIAETRRSETMEEFRLIVRPIIQARLMAVLQSELILSEAETSLSTQQQQGLLAFLRQLQEEEVAERGGSEVQAEQELLESEGVTLDQYMQQQIDERLIQDVRYRKILPRVVVSWRDIEREYDRNHDQFNPPPQVTLARIRLSSTQTEQIEDVKRRLADREDFAEIADAVGMAERGRWDTFTVGPGGISDIPINDTYKPYLEGLEGGDTTEPFEVRGRMMWLHVSSIEQPEGRSLYDPEVQEILHNAIFQRRFLEEQNRYFANLMEKSTLDDLEQMFQRVMAIAAIRYGP